MTPTYDGNGNLAYDGSFTYCYDAESRLTSVISAGTCASPTTIVASYAYDGQGRRKSRTVGGTTTLYVTDADNREVLEYDGAAGAIQRWYAYGIGPDAVLNQMNAPGTPTRATLIPDIQGSIVGTLHSGSRPALCPAASTSPTRASRAVSAVARHMPGWRSTCRAPAGSSSIRPTALSAVVI